MTESVSSRTNTARRKENILTGPFFDELRKRKKQGRDAKIFFTAENGATGVGKTHAATTLGYVVDTSPPVEIGGFDHRFRPEKCTVHGPKWMRLYDRLAPGSFLLGDEWTSEGDARRSVSNANVRMSYQWAMRRYREIMSGIVLPSKADLDERLQRLADYWVLVTERGEAIIHKVKIGRYDDRLWFDPMQEWSFPNLDGDPVIEWLDYAKANRLEGDDNQQYYTDDEVEDVANEARLEGKKEAQLEVVAHCLNRGLTQSETGDLLGVNQPRVSQLKQEAEKQGYMAATG